jgi:hypothetical protein
MRKPLFLVVAVLVALAGLPGVAGASPSFISVGEYVDGDIDTYLLFKGWFAVDTVVTTDWYDRNGVLVCSENFLLDAGTVVTATGIGVLSEDCAALIGQIGSVIVWDQAFSNLVGGDVIVLRATGVYRYVLSGFDFFVTGRWPYYSNFEFAVTFIPGFINEIACNAPDRDQAAFMGILGAGNSNWDFYAFDASVAGSQIVPLTNVSLIDVGDVNLTFASNGGEVDISPFGPTSCHFIISDLFGLTSGTRFDNFEPGY